MRYASRAVLHVLVSWSSVCAQTSDVGRQWACCACQSLALVRVLYGVSVEAMDFTVFGLGSSAGHVPAAVPGGGGGAVQVVGVRVSNKGSSILCSAYGAVPSHV